MWVPHPFAKQKGGTYRPGTTIDPEPPTLQSRLAARHKNARRFNAGNAGDLISQPPPGPWSPRTVGSTVRGVEATTLFREGFSPSVFRPIQFSVPLWWAVSAVEPTAADAARPGESSVLSRNLKLETSRSPRLSVVVTNQ